MPLPVWLFTLLRFRCCSCPVCHACCVLWFFVPLPVIVCFVILLLLFYLLRWLPFLILCLPLPYPVVAICIVIVPYVVLCWFVRCSCWLDCSRCSRCTLLRSLLPFLLPYCCCYYLPFEFTLFTIFIYFTHRCYSYYPLRYLWTLCHYVYFIVLDVTIAIYCLHAACLPTFGGLLFTFITWFLVVFIVCLRSLPCPTLVSLPNLILRRFVLTFL